MRCPHCKEKIYKDKVTDNRRGWYRAGILPFLQKVVPSWSDLTLDQVHEVLKTEFNGFQIEDKNGNMRKYGQSVSSNQVNSDVFDNYIARIAEWVRSNYALELPTPQEYKEKRDSAELINK